MTEAVSEEFIKYVGDGISHANRSLSERFDSPPEVYNRLYYHNSQHSKEVMEKTSEILQFIGESIGQISEQHALLAKFAAAFHDLNQDWEPEQSFNRGLTIAKRTHKAGEIEDKSFLEANQFMIDSNTITGRDLFTGNDRFLVRECILATVPAFDLALGTVIQPNISPTSSIAAQAVALADLGVAGIDGPHLFLRDTDALFLEENIDFLEALLDPNILNPTKKEFYRERILDWTARQIRFTAGRQARLQIELANLPEIARPKIASIFDKFDQTLETMDSILSIRKSMSYEEIVNHAGFYSLLALT